MRGIVTHALNQLSEAAEGWEEEGGGLAQDEKTVQVSPCWPTHPQPEWYICVSPCKSRAQVDDGEEQSSPRESATDVKRPLLPIVAF